MARALTRGAADPPETVFLAWLLSVPHDLDPAEAAGRMLVRFAGPRLVSGSAGRERLIELLNDTTRWPYDRLSWLARRKRERQPAERKSMRRRTWR